MVGHKRLFSETGESATNSARASSRDVAAPGPEHGSEPEPGTGMELESIAGPGPRLGLRLQHDPVPTPAVASLPRVSKDM